MPICTCLRALPLLLLCLAEARAIVVSGSDPNDPMYLSSLTGVGRINSAGGACSGSLLSTGRHFLTAAHCVVNPSGNFVDTSFSITFQNSSLTEFTYITGNAVYNPDFSPTVIGSPGDIAVLTLNQFVDPSIERMSLYTGTGELESLAIIAGYGRQGTGATGSVANTFGTRRQGLNRVDAIQGSTLLFDFDSGSIDQSLFGTDLGEGLNEVGIAQGDSGGPTLIGGRIAGVHSYLGCAGSNGFCFTPPDVDGTLNSSFGEYFGDTRVSVYANWIQSVIDAPAEIPEPATFAGSLVALGAVIAAARRNRK